MEPRYRNPFTRRGLNFDRPRPEDLVAVLEFLDRDLGWAQLDAALHHHHDEVCRRIVARTQDEQP